MPRFPRWLPSDCDQEKFLLSRQDLYLKAVDEGKTKEFFAETIAIWAPQFSWTRPPGSPADPSIPVEIEALMQYYDIPEEQRSEFEEWQMASLDDERQKIMNFYKNHVAKPARNAARDQGIILSRSSSPQPLGPFGPIRLKGENHRRKALTKSHRTDKDTFARLFPERVDNAMAETTYTRNNFLATRSRIAQSLLNNASEAEKLQTTVETERLRADDKVKQELLATPQANAIYATALPSQLKDELNALASRTGFIFTLFCGGYDEDGEPIAYVVEAGTLGKAIPTTFGTYIGAEVRNSILDRLRKFMENRNCE
ncbi:hypothetical protein DL93DRAFT_241242 [Clavulina sp. PMI_390]|nr:hypothetical protein DL93DRAFT_241242 [Clavulina sp. PMI_390]